MGWAPFREPQSAVQYYEIGVGSAPGLSDVVPLLRLPDGDVGPVTVSLDVLHRRVIFATVVAWNYVGLSAAEVWQLCCSARLWPAGPPSAPDAHGGCIRAPRLGVANPLGGLAPVMH